MRTYLSILLLMLAGFAQAQVTTFPSNVTAQSLIVGYGPSNVLAVTPSGTTNAGKFVVRPLSSGTSYVRVEDTNGTPRMQLGVYPGFPEFGALWFGDITPRTTNYSLTSDGTTTTINGAGTITLATGVGGSKWIVDTTGHFLAATDNLYDIGAPGATRPRSVHIGTMPGSGDHVAVNANGLLMRTNITSGSTQMVTAAIGTLTVSNTFSVPIFNTITGNFAFINLTNFLGSNQVRIGMAQLTNVSFVSLAEGNSLFWNSTMEKFTNAPGGSGSGSTQMVSAAIGVLLQTNDISFVVSNQANIGSFLIPSKTNYANAFYAGSPSTNQFGPSTFFAHISAPTNIAAFVLTTNDLTLNTYYTNSGQRSWISATIAMTNVLATEKAMVALYLDQNGDGTWERTGLNCRLQGVIALSGSEQLTAFLQPNARFIFTNLGTVGNATIEANSSQWIRQ